MRIIDPCVYVPYGEIQREKIRLLERYGRVCYKSEKQIGKDSADSFIRRLIKSGHESVIEHEKATVLMITDRGISHEIVRHRIASYSQESTRYCNYSKDRFGQEITVVKPFFFDNTSLAVWEQSCRTAEAAYFDLLREGTPQEARSVLPNSLKTEIVVTYNFREWRHFFNLRCSAAAHPQMRQITIPLLLAFRSFLPSLFEDIQYDKTFPQEFYAEVIFTDSYFGEIDQGQTRSFRRDREQV